MWDVSPPINTVVLFGLVNGDLPGAGADAAPEAAAEACAREGGIEGTPIYGASEPETKSVAGKFIKLLPTRDEAVLINRGAWVYSEEANWKLFCDMDW